MSYQLVSESEADLKSGKYISIITDRQGFIR